MRRNRRKRFGRRAHGNEDMALQITSMADIFTIILVFLLKSFATGTTSIEPAREITLPESVMTDPMSETNKIEISEHGILLDDKQVADLRNFRFERGSLESDGSIRSLNTVLHDLQRNPASTDEAAAVPVTPPKDLSKSTEMLVVADKKTPYTTIKTVLDTLSSNGFSDFKLVVVEDQ
jgi:biopolymer transport protein ExbD